MMTIITTVIGIECIDENGQVSDHIGLLIRDKPEFTPILIRKPVEEKSNETSN